MAQGDARIGLFGGSFNPPHVGHMLAVAYTLSIGEVDEVWALPVHQHAFEKDLESFEHRVEMLTLALAPLRQTCVSRVEQDLPAPNYTLHTVQHLRKLHPSASFRLIVGGDALAERHRWYGFEELTALAPLLVLRRASELGLETDVETAGRGLDISAGMAAVLPAISSSQVRAWLRDTSDESTEFLRAFVPRDVLDYIRAHGLYAPTKER